MKSKDVLKLLKITRPTLCRWVKEGKLRAIKINKTVLDYNEDDVFKLAGIENRANAVIYARVSTQQQESSLNNQIETPGTARESNGNLQTIERTETPTIQEIWEREDAIRKETQEKNNYSPQE